MLVLRGQAGIGKTALLRYCAEQAVGCRVEHLSGIESELELPYAALHQLCAPILSNASTLPAPQERALLVAFGLAPGSAPDRFLVGLAVLGLLAELAAQQPLVCLVDDAQWLDQSSLQVLGFVGRRLVAESVLLLFAVREPTDERLFGDLPDLTIEGLTGDDARALLASTVNHRLDERVRDRIIAETGGNPLAILELRRMGPAELAGGYGMPTAATVSAHIEDGYVRRINALPERTRQLVLLAAADPTGDATLLWRAALTLGIGRDAAAAADVDRLLEIGGRVRFRHPLVRSAAYAAALPEHRCAAHLALAEATDVRTDPERRVWHLAAAATGPDEGIASALERIAHSVQGRAGLAAAAAFMHRAVELSADVGLRADRALAAAQAHLNAGAYDAARGLLAEAAALAVDDLQRARVEQLDGQIEAAANPGREAPGRLLHAARRLEPLDAQLARDTYLQAWWAAVLAGEHATPGGGLVEISRAVRAAPSPAHPRVCDLLLVGLATVITHGRQAAAPYLRPAIDLFLKDQVSDDEWLQCGRSATTAALALWDMDSWTELSSRQIDRTRASGALASLVLSLNLHAFGTTNRGDLEAAAALVAEQNAVREATGTRMASYGARLLAAYQGHPFDQSPQIDALDAELVRNGDGYVIEVANHATAVLNNGLGRYSHAIAAARRVAYTTGFMAPFALSELIEAAVRAGNTDLAKDAVQRLSALTVVGSDWAAGIEARGRALTSDGDAADQYYTDSITCLSRTPLRPDVARSQLLYGEWLRRGSRRLESRHQLRLAHEALVEMGLEAFAERARRELLATGEHVRKRRATPSLELTPQETHIARLARDGRTNPEIGAELFLSTRTVEWHMGKVLIKLGITSRRELRDVLPPPGQ